MIDLLAAGSTNSSTISNVEPGLLGFVVVAALGLALVFLLRSMNRQFRKIGPAPEDPEDTEASAADEAPDDGDGPDDSDGQAPAQPGWQRKSAPWA